MAKSESLKRLIWLQDVIERYQPVSLKEIMKDYQQSILYTEDPNYSRRTFFRDLGELRGLFNCDIHYSHSEKGYCINKDLYSSNTSDLIEAFRRISVLQYHNDVSKYIAFERHSTGSEYLHFFLSSIKKREQVEFKYQKFVDDEISERMVEPYFLKEFRNRWYIVAKDKKDNKTKTFALERIQKNTLYSISGSLFDMPPNLKANTFFKDSFGIFRNGEKPLEEIEISVITSLKAKFLKTSKLHHSQRTLFENKKELRIVLQVQITHDFIMALLSHSPEIKIFKPKSLKERVIGDLKKTILNYNE